METYGFTEDEHNFALREINNLTLCNEFAELYIKSNECCMDDLENVYGEPEEGEEEEDRWPQEIFQWYLVDDYQAEKLIEIGEPVLKTESNNLWGRTCCGQAIILDGTFQRIHKSLG